MPQPTTPCPQCGGPCKMYVRHLPNYYCPSCQKWYRTDAPPPEGESKLDYTRREPRGGYF